MSKITAFTFGSFVASSIKITKELSAQGFDKAKKAAKEAKSVSIQASKDFKAGYNSVKQ